jgi:hypothetical protein
MLFKTIFAATALVGTALATFDIRTGQTEAFVSDAAEVCYQSFLPNINTKIILSTEHIYRQCTIESHRQLRGGYRDPV